MKKCFFISLISLMLSTTIDFPLPLYEVKPYDKIELNKGSACICFELPNDSKKGNSFYFQVICDETGAKIDKIIYYNFTETCNINECDYNSYLYSKKNDKLSLDNEGSGFYYEYKFEVEDDKNKYIKVQYKDFTGNKFTMQYIPLSMTSVFVTIFILFILFIVIIVCIICCICRCRKRKNEQFKENSNLVPSPLFPEDNTLNPQPPQLIELHKY